VTRAEVRRAAEAVLDHPGADAVEVVIGAASSGVTRYAGSEIIQNIGRDELQAFVRVVVGDRAASAATNQLDAGHMTTAAGAALEAARASLPDPDFPGLPSPAEVGEATPVGRWDDDTAAASPAQRAEAVKEIVAATAAGAAAGIYETGAHAWAVISSEGIDCFDAFTRCVMTCLADVGDATGWGDDSSHALSEVDAAGAARRAIAKAEASRGATDAEPGSYDVVLEPVAAGTLLDYLSYAGFGAKQMLEGESFFAERRGQGVADPSVTIVDDVRHPRSVGIGFDFEGLPRQRVAVIDGGVATGPVSDLRSARKLSEPPTGHSSGSAEFGAYAANIIMEPGHQDLEELIAGVEEGFLVTRFHYVNILDRPTTLLTGMTRDGTFRISGGEVAGPVRNFRFAQSVLEALANVRGVGRDLVALAPEFGSFGSTAAPALRVDGFHFASTTSH